MTTYSGRVEGKYTVPASTTLSVSSGALTSAVSVTWTAGSYFHSAMGGVSSGITALQTAINAAVSPYPDNATSMGSAIGYSFTGGAGWGFNISSGNDTGMFGGVTMTAVSSPTYLTDGPSSYTGDYAVGFNSAADAFSAGDVYDVNAAADLIVAWVGYVSAAPGASSDWFGKRSGGAGWYLFRNNAGDLYLFGDDGVDSLSCSATPPLGEWHVGIATIDRSTQKMRISIKGLTSGTVSTSSETSTTALGDTSNAIALTVGAGNFASVDTDLKVAAFYVNAGSGIAAGLSAGLATAVANFASAINSTFFVSLSTSTGLVTCSNSFWPCAMDFDANTMSLLGYAYDFDYPQTAAQMATACGYGTWTAGYLLNESSGNAVAAFGAPATLTAAGTPIYSALGARGGTDKAIGFDAAADTFSAAGLGVGASEDIAFLWVGRATALSAAQQSRLASKSDGVSTYYTIDGYGAANRWVFELVSGVGATADAGTGSTFPGEWHVGIAVLDRSTNKVRVGARSLLDGDSIVSAEVSAAGLGAVATTGTFFVGSLMSQPLYLAALYVAQGSGAATGLSANLSTALSNFATYMKSQTGTQQARGLWLPDCPLNIEGDPAVAPRVTDKRSTQNPNGQLLSLVGNSLRRHRGVVWSHVPRAQVWETAATYTNGSFERFADDVLYGLGHAWFTPSSPVQIYWNSAGTDRAVGYTFNSSAGIPGWYVVNVDSTEPKKSSGDWTGLFRIEFGDIVASES